MIDENKTFKEFGYYSTDLKPKSTKKIIAICDDCNKERIVKKYSYTKLCGSCVQIGKRNHFFGKRHLEESKRRISITHSGENGCMWNLNITDEERKQRREYPEYIEWRKLVYKRDNYTCQICGNISGGNLNAHHLEGYNNNQKLRTVISNGITLCKTCHKKFHHKYGKGNNTKSQFIKFQADNK